MSRYFLCSPHRTRANWITIIKNPAKKKEEAKERIKTEKKKKEKPLCENILLLFFWLANPESGLNGSRRVFKFKRDAKQFTILKHVCLANSADGFDNQQQ